MHMKQGAPGLLYALKQEWYRQEVMLNSEWACALWCVCNVPVVQRSIRYPAHRTKLFHTWMPAARTAVQCDNEHYSVHTPLAFADFPSLWANVIRMTAEHCSKAVSMASVRPSRRLLVQTQRAASNISCSCAQLNTAGSSAASPSSPSSHAACLLPVRKLSRRACQHRVKQNTSNSSSPCNSRSRVGVS